MDIYSKEKYSTLNYKAIVVNNDVSQDPLNQNRIQIYIPYLQSEYSITYQEYLKDTNKPANVNFNKFPWAVSLVDNLNNGDSVYGGYIDNDSDKCIILGTDIKNNPKPNDNQVTISNTSNLMDLAMPIILQNEIGIKTEDYPNAIPLNKYTLITPYDNGGWSIGIIQWHHGRAYDCLFEIIKNKSNWQDSFTDKSLTLFNDLRTSLNLNNSSGQRNKYGANFHPTTGTSLYNAIQSLLGSEEGKKAQLEYAKVDIQNVITDLQNNYNINNIAIIIFLVDIMNQYGSGIKKTKEAARQCSQSNEDKITQLNKFIVWCTNNLGSYNTYKRRRNNTYQYILELEKQGKLNPPNLATIANTSSGNGYQWPVPGCLQINCFYGDRTTQQQDINQKKWKWGGLYHRTPHSGIDIAPKRNGVAGDPCIAIGSGKVVYNAAELSPNGGRGYVLIIELQNPPKGKEAYKYAQYMHMVKQSHLQVGQKVQAGQVIGYMGNTGASRGVHLHIGLYSSWQSGGMRNSTNILPFLNY